MVEILVEIITFPKNFLLVVGLGASTASLG